MLESSPSHSPTLAELGAEAEIVEAAIAALEETLCRADFAEADREKTERDLAGLQCRLAQLRTRRRHAAIRSAMS